MPTPTGNPENTVDLGQRLDCWKEIASYLGKGERTVKRWETDRGLPIHRVPGGGRASVYAHTEELDEWMKSSEVPELDASTEDTEDAEEADPLDSGNIDEDLADDAAPANLPLLAPPAKQPFLRSRLLLAFGVL